MVYGIYFLVSLLTHITSKSLSHSAMYRWIRSDRISFCRFHRCLCIYRQYCMGFNSIQTEAKESKQSMNNFHYRSLLLQSMIHISVSVPTVNQSSFETVTKNSCHFLSQFLSPCALFLFFLIRK